MRNYLAFYRDENSHIKNMIEEYDSVKDFETELRGNGYSVIMVLTEKRVKEIFEADYLSDIKLSIFKTQSEDTRKSIMRTIEQTEEIKNTFKL